jgi:IS5 family transposase
MTAMETGCTGAERRVPEQRGRGWFIAEKRGEVRAIEDDELRMIVEAVEHKQASAAQKVEDPFRVVKRQFGYI